MMKLRYNQSCICILKMMHCIVALCWYTNNWSLQTVVACVISVLFVSHWECYLDKEGIVECLFIVCVCNNLFA